MMATRSSRRHHAIKRVEKLDDAPPPGPWPAAPLSPQLPSRLPSALARPRPIRPAAANDAAGALISVRVTQSSCPSNAGDGCALSHARHARAKCADGGRQGCRTGDEEAACGATDVADCAVYVRRRHRREGIAARTPARQMGRRACAAPNQRVAAARDSPTPLHQLATRVHRRPASCWCAALLAASAAAAAVSGGRRWARILARRQGHT